MANTIGALQACRADLFASRDELRAKYPAALAERVERMRQMYNHWLANPGLKDRQLRDYVMAHHGVSQRTAYNDITILRQLVPLLATHSREWHRARANEMALETYAIAKAQHDTKTMERCIATYGKINSLDKPDDLNPEYDLVPVQPFCATLDVRVLGVEPIPDIYNYISKLTRELLNDHHDIIDVEAEEADLEEQHLFLPLDVTAPDTDQPQVGPDLF